jgi:hypothetical protein
MYITYPFPEPRNSRSSANFSRSSCSPQFQRESNSSPRFFAWPASQIFTTERMRSLSLGWSWNKTTALSSMTPKEEEKFWKSLISTLFLLWRRPPFPAIEKQVHEPYIWGNPQLDFDPAVNGFQNFGQQTGNNRYS